ncbi:MAG: ATP-binding protein, partial [Burkholderiales bacterium]
AYVWFAERGPADGTDERRARAASAYGTLTLLASAAALAALATLGESLLPAIMLAGQKAPAMYPVVGSVWLTCFVALVMLWRRRSHSVLDLWLVVVMCAWLFDIALSAVFNAARFDVGFYAGRIYGLLAATYVLMELLVENGRLYAKLVALNHQEREQAVALAAARDQAQAADRAKGQFLATMSHEIRTPLNGLLGMLELLSLSPLNGEQRETLEVARDSGHGLVRIIDDVLDHAKIEAGKLEIRLEPVSVTELLRRVVNTYHAVASAHDLALKQAVDPRISPSLLADPLRVLQILNNLVSNALKFTSEGYVEIRAELIERAGDADTVRFLVKDTGIGIAPEAQKQLFRPFEQAEAVTARLYGGTGLGLSISRRLAQMMGGSIRMQSALGEGTTMSLTLTLSITQAAPAEPGKRAAMPADSLYAPGESPRVLAVDDHSTNRELLARQLAALGLRVRKAADGEEALALWRDGGFGLIITDCNMPRMDGYALTQAIRGIEAKAGLPRTPIIAWTANVLPGAVAQCRAAGIDDILTKPAELAVLKETLSKWLPSAVMAKRGPEAAADARSGAVQAAAIELAELNKVAATAAEQAEILLDFMSQTRSDLAELEAAVAHDLPACARIAHRVKGSSRMVGARELAAACEAMERAVRQGSPEDAGLAKAAMERARERLEAHLAETTAQARSGK